MSRQSARNFLDRMRSDPALAGKMAEASTPEERLALSRTLGFDFTAEELKMARRELSDDDLDRITGGLDNPACVPVAFFVSG